MAPVAELPPGVTRDLPAAFREAGWSFTEKEHGMLWVNLETPTGTTNFRAQVRTREAEGVRIMAILAQFDSLSRDSRHSLGHLLLRASGSLRLVRASAWTKSGEAGLAFEVFIPTRETPRPAEIDHALSALSMACSVCGPEAEALQDRVLARNYLRMRGRASHGNPNGSVAQKSAGGTKHGNRGNE